MGVLLPSRAGSGFILGSHWEAKSLSIIDGELRRNSAMSLKIKEKGFLGTEVLGDV